MYIHNLKLNSHVFLFVKPVKKWSNHNQPVIERYKEAIKVD